LKILRALKINGSPLPEYETNDERDYLIVTIHMHDEFKKDEHLRIQINKQLSGQKNKDKKENTYWNEVVSENRQIKILMAIKENPLCTLEQLEEETGISAATLKLEMDYLKDEKEIKYVGSEDYGHWELAE